MSIGLLLLIVLIIVLVGGFRDWGPGPFYGAGNFGGIGLGTSFTINPGQTKTLTAVYADKDGKNEPLASLPVATDPSGTLTITPVGTPTVNDAQFQWTMACPATAPVGTALTVNTTAEGDPTPGVNTITGSITGTVVALEDTQVTLSVA